MNEKIKAMREAGIVTLVNGEIKKLSFNDAIKLRDDLIQQLATLEEE